MPALRHAAWLLMTLSALGVAGYSVAYMLVPELGGEMRARLGQMPLAFFAHLGGGLVAMSVGPFQLHRGLRARALGAHRVFGYTYAVAVLAGGLGGLWLAFFSQAGLVTHLGFGTLAVLWLWTTAMAVARIRVGDQAAHREWMIRSFALTLAAVTLRIYLPASLISGVPFPLAYKVIAWACWVPNLLIAEAIVRATRPRTRVLTAPAGR